MDYAYPENEREDIDGYLIDLAGSVTAELIITKGNPQYVILDEFEGHMLGTTSVVASSEYRVALKRVPNADSSRTIR